MNKLTIYALSAALSLPTAALSQTQSDSRTYRNCLNQAQSTADMRNCNAAEIAVHDRRLNTAYRALRAKMNPQEQTRLPNIQRQWIRQRDQQALAASRAAGGGTAAGLEADRVLLEMTRRRADELEAMLRQR